MGVRVVNLCVNVRVATVQITVEGSDFCKDPPSAPFYFRVWSEADGQGTSSSGSSVSLTAAGQYRVAAWTDEDPGTVPSTIFSTPTEVSDQVQVRFSGGECNVNSGGGQDPWPPN